MEGPDVGALFVVNAFPFYNGVSPYNAYTGRQPAFLPDLVEYDTKGENSSGGRDDRVREKLRSKPSQSTAVAKINRAL